LRQTVAQARADRERIEAELFDGPSHLSSKNDDELPLDPRPRWQRRGGHGHPGINVPIREENRHDPK
jgi:hypothetical protein